MDELDAEPTIEELDKAIDTLSNGKAPGSDGIPPEVIKSGKFALAEPLHELLVSAGRKAPSHKTCVMPPSSPFIRTKVTTQTVTTIKAFLS